MIHYITTQGLGQPWVGNELHAVQSAGIPVVLHAMRLPEQRLFDAPWAADLGRRTRTLYPLPAGGLILSVLLAPWLFGRRFFRALINALFGERESLRTRVATLSHFFVACHWARGLRRETLSHIHSQWAHSSASIGMYGAWLLGVSFSFTGHAVDIFRDRAALRDKIRRSEFIICISTFHRDFFLGEGASPGQLPIAYCGIDADLFRPGGRPRRPKEPYQILSAGRLVEKKGFAYLIDACHLLATRGERFECMIAGSGELEGELRQQVARQGLGDCVRITGMPLVQARIPRFMRQGDVFVLPCVRASDDDVDGLPQLTMEAMACGLPAITTRIVGNPDLVVDGETGVLVEPNTVEPLADAIQGLMHDPLRAERLAKAGRARVLERFNLATSLEPLIALYRQKLGGEVGTPLPAGVGGEPMGARRAAGAQ